MTGDLFVSTLSIGTVDQPSVGIDDEDGEGDDRLPEDVGIRLQVSYVSNIRTCEERTR
jgi:hypothetical protein